MLTDKAAGNKRKSPRRNVRLRGKGEKAPRREAGFGVRLIWFFFKKLVFAAFLVVLTLVFIFAYDYVTQTRLLALTEIKITGNVVISDKELIAASGLEMGANLFGIDTDEVRQKLLSLEWIKDVEVKRDLPFRIIFEVFEQEALLCADLGQIFIVNTDGCVFKPAMAENTQKMPTVRGLNISAEYWVDAPDFCLWTAKRGIPPTEVNKIAALQEFLSLCETNSNVLDLRFISDIETDGLTGITAILRDGRVVKFGFGNLAKKFSNYSRFVANADSFFANAEIKAVDLRDTARIVVKQEVLPADTQGR